MNRRRTTLDRVPDSDGDRIDPRKALIANEIRRRAITDADRSFQKVRAGLRKLAREVHGAEARGAK